MRARVRAGKRAVGRFLRGETTRRSSRVPSVARGEGARPRRRGLLGAGGGLQAREKAGDVATRDPIGTCERTGVLENGAGGSGRAVRASTRTTWGK